MAILVEPGATPAELCLAIVCQECIELNGLTTFIHTIDVDYALCACAVCGQPSDSLQLVLEQLNPEDAYASYRT